MKSSVNKSNHQFYEDLKEALHDVLDYKKGKIHLRSQDIEIPEPPAQYGPKDIKI